MDIEGHLSYTSLCQQPTEKILRALAWESTQLFTWSRCKHVEREAVSQLEFEKDGISEKKRKRGSLQSSLPDPTYDHLMMTVTKLEGTVATLTETVSSLHGTIRTFESRLLALEGDARDSTLTHTVSSLQGTITTLESRMLALEGDEREFGVMRCTIPPPASTTMPPVTTISLPKDAVTTISVPMTTTEKLKDTIHIDAAAKDTFCIEDELQFKGMEKGDKPNYALPDLSKLKRNKYPIYSKFEKKKIDCYLDCLPKGRICEPSFWDILYPGDEKAEYLEEGKLDGLHINAFIELMMRKRPCNAQWTLGLSELVAFHIDSRKLMSMVSVVDALRATIDGTNPSSTSPPSFPTDLLEDLFVFSGIGGKSPATKEHLEDINRLIFRSGHDIKTLHNLSRLKLKILALAPQTAAVPNPDWKVLSESSHRSFESNDIDELAGITLHFASELVMSDVLFLGQTMASALFLTSGVGPCDCPPECLDHYA
nr:hypothetical protein [Tanacetum cinerariifolium]